MLKCIKRSAYRSYQLLPGTIRSLLISVFYFNSSSSFSTPTFPSCFFCVFFFSFTLNKSQRLINIYSSKRSTVFSYRHCEIRKIPACMYFLQKDFFFCSVRKMQECVCVYEHICIKKDVYESLTRIEMMYVT